MLHNLIKNCLPYGITKKYFDRPRIIASKEHPKLYNEFGEEMKVMYLADYRAKQYSLMSGRYPKTIFWDRGNPALQLQMYSHLTMLNRIPVREDMRQFGLMVESETICPHDYEQILNHADKITSLNTLFTYSERLLDKYENAKFVIGNGVWYGTEMYGGSMSLDNFEKKNKIISIVASAKTMTPLHLFRANVARELKTRHLAEAMGTAVGSYFEKISDAFDDFILSLNF